MDNEYSVYIIFKNGCIVTNLDPIWIQFLSHGICIEYCIGDEIYTYEEVYAIGKILDESCEVLWKQEEDRI